MQEPKKRPGRPPAGERALTHAEVQREYRKRMKEEQERLGRRIRNIYLTDAELIQVTAYINEIRSASVGAATPTDA